MASNNDIRWMQRFDNYKKALTKLNSVTDSGRGPEDLSELEKSGLIQWFEFTYELAWKVMQDYLVYKGYDFQKGPNGTIKMALEDGLIDDQDGWRNMQLKRNLVSHTYDGNEADEIVEQIYDSFTSILNKLNNTLSEQYGKGDL